MSTIEKAPGLTSKGEETQSGTPFHLKTGTYAQAQKDATDAASTLPNIKTNMPHDGRKGSVTSPAVEDWRPSINRQQSWNQEDLKRDRVVKDLEKNDGRIGGGGFTEGGEGTRKV